MAGVYEDRRGPRAVQWTVPAGIESCDLTEADVWIAFCNEHDDDATAWLVDGDTGDVLVEIPITGFMCEMMGPYGGAIDADNDFWFIENDTRKAIYRVDYDCEPAPGDPCWEAFDRPDADMDNYGITADGKGRVWVAGQGNSLYYYWPAMDEWRNLEPELDAFFAAEAAKRTDGAALADNILRGLMMDDDEVLWVATVQEFSGGPYAGVLKVDTSQDPFEYTYYSKETLGPELQHAAGISIDVEGHVWLVDTFSNGAYKIPPSDPSSYTRVGGLNQPYTYSDMTGYGLTQVAFPPQG
jgi:streptogramin lyase